MIPSLTEFYFAYGSNMSSVRLRRRIPHAVAVGAASLADHRLRFDKPSRDGSGKANLSPASGNVGWGVVYRLAATDWTELDRYEPGYLRHSVEVEVEGAGRLCAQSYFACIETDDRLTPHAWYLAHLIDGAKEHGLPDEYLRALSAVRCRPGGRDPEQGGA